MNTNGKELNTIERKFKRQLETLMFNEEVKFPVFLYALRNDIPEDKSSNDYKNKHKAEYLKLLRASFSVEEVVKMLEVLHYKLKLTLNETPFGLKKLSVEDMKIKYTDFLAVCDMMGVDIDWVKEAKEHGNVK